MSQERRVRRRAGVSPSVVVLSLLLGWACNSAPAPPTAPSRVQTLAPSPAPPAPAAPAPAPFARYNLSGVVTDEAGSPLSGALVEVDHYRGGGSFSNPASSCPDSPAWCWLVTYASGAGRYAVELDAAPSPQYPGTIGYVFSFYGGFEANTQFVPSGPTDVVQNLRLRRVRGIRAGASTTVSIESDSTRCTDLEDLWVMNSRCEAIQVVADAGTLVVQAQATEAGRAAPSVYWATTGNYAGIPTRPGPGVVSIPVGGGTYLIFVGVPADTASAPQSFSVSTTLHSTGGH